MNLKIFFDLGRESDIFRVIMPNGLLNLSELKPGESARIIRFDGMTETHLRLMEMGLIPGTLIKCLRTAPLGDPLEVEVRGYNLSLRKVEAATITIERGD